MRIFGVGLVTLAAIGIAYWAGSKNMLNRLVSAVA